MQPVAERRNRCELRGVVKALGGNPVLKGIDLSIGEGRFVVLVGPSGCGKSTLLRVVAGLESVDRGRVLLAGRDVTDLAPRDRDLAMVFQSYALYPHLTVKENMAFGLRLRQTPAAEIESRVAEAARILGLEPLFSRLPKQLSGGQRQRVAMGRAIVRTAQIYLYDEPLSNLDAALRAEVRVEIRKLHDRLRATSLYVTHDQVEAMTLADDLFVLKGGTVEQSGPPMEVYRRPRTRFVAGFLGSPPMNFVDGAIERSSDGATFVGAGLSVPIDDARFGGAIADGMEVTAGLRPHDVTLGAAEAGAREVGEVDVELVEALGFGAFAYGRLASGERFVARADEAVRGGGRAPLFAARSAVHLFERSGERALDALDSPRGA
jgi:sn-glycerol 3-phosphate transport system ATP-binding protein/multiple sugar transport system ATP-binding protein